MKRSKRKVVHFIPGGSVKTSCGTKVGKNMCTTYIKCRITCECCKVEEGEPINFVNKELVS